MPKTIKNEETGEDEVVYSKEELDAQRDEATQEYIDAHPDQAEKVTELEANLVKAQEDLAKANDKSGNFSNLRKLKEDAEKALADFKKDTDTKIEGIRTDMSNTALEAAIKGLAGEDVELAKKVRFHFSETLKAVSSKNTEEFTKKVQQAYLLAAGREVSPGQMSGAIYGSGGAGPGAGFQSGAGAGAKGKPIDPRVVEMGKKYLGLTDDDFKKYDKQDFSHTK
jgi:hypothetical protein